MATAPVKSSPNRAPLVDAGADQVIVLGQTAILSGIIQDDDMPVPLAQVAAQWSKVSGPGGVTFANPAALSTTASFAVAGTYVIQLTGNDSALSTSSQLSINVLSSAPPDLSAGVVDGSAGDAGGDGGGDDLGGIAKNPGGCGCDLTGTTPPPGALVFVGLLTLLAVGRRKLR